MSTKSTSSNKRPRVGHTKSRKGCLNCRKRHVKCNEKHPICSSCQRLDLDCSYAQEFKIIEAQNLGIINQASASRLSPKAETICSDERHVDSSSATQPSSPFRFLHPSSDVGSSSWTLRETCSRRQLELRLLHHWMSRSFRPNLSAENSEWRKIWHSVVPGMALQHANLHHALMALSATQLSGVSPSDTGMNDARDEYWVMALQEQQKAIEASKCHTSISKDTNASAATIFAGLLIAINGYAKLKDRLLDPYVPPVPWLDLAKSAWLMMEQPQQLSPDSAINTIMEIASPVWPHEPSANEFTVDNLYQPILQHAFLSIQHADDNHNLHVYAKVLNVIGTFRRGVEDEEPGHVQLRRLCTFPMAVPSEFIALLKKGTSAARAVLACFFAVAKQCKRALHIFGDGAERIPNAEYQAIIGVLSTEWQRLVP